MKYITKFTDHTAYTAAESSLVEPNVSYCVNENEVHYKPIEPPTPNPLYYRTISVNLDGEENQLNVVVDSIGRLVLIEGSNYSGTYIIYQYDYSPPSEWYRVGDPEWVDAIVAVAESTIVTSGELVGEHRENLVFTIDNIECVNYSTRGILTPSPQAL